MAKQIFVCKRPIQSYTANNDSINLSDEQIDNFQFKSSRFNQNTSIDLIKFYVCGAGDYRDKFVCGIGIFGFEWNRCVSLSIRFNLYSHLLQFARGQMKKQKSNYNFTGGTPEPEIWIFWMPTCANLNFAIQR